MGRAPCCEKVGLRRGRWNAEEDRILSDYIQANGEGSWRSLPKKAGLLRCGKSCRLRWINYLRCDVKRGNISKDEEDTIIKLHASIGNRWSLIASHLAGGRTDNEIKNYWNSHLSRKITPTTTKRRSRRTSDVKMKKPLPLISKTLSSSNMGEKLTQNINSSSSSSSSSSHKEKEKLEEDHCSWFDDDEGGLLTMVDHPVLQKDLTDHHKQTDDDDMGKGDQQAKNNIVSITNNGSQQQQLDIWECDWDFERLELEGLEGAEDHSINSMLLSWPWDEEDTTQTPTPLLTQVIADPPDHHNNTDTTTTTTTQKKKQADAIIAWLLS